MAYCKISRPHRVRWEYGIMRVRFQEFSPRKFDFHKDPILVLEDFWSAEERARFREGMSQTKWKALSEMPEVSAAFPNSGDWLKGEIGSAEAQIFMEKLSLPCIVDYIESFPDIKDRHLSFSYYSYGAGDCLPTHDDTDEAYARDQQSYRALRRIACATYFHDEWDPDWGGELIIYNARQKKGQRVLEINQCIIPQPGSLALFTVPRFHRVCRVDTLAGPHKRLSIAGWFMTEHYG